MCFSAEASFAASGMLAAVGAYCVHHARGRQARYLPVAAMPLLFAAQQFVEGWLWLALGRGDPPGVHSLALLYLFFAFGVWPFYCPWLAYRLETGSARRRRLLLAFTVAGAGVGAMVYLPLLVGSTEVATSVVNGSIAYETSRPPLQKQLYTLAYVIVTLTPFMIASDRRLLLFSLLLLAAMGVTVLFYAYAFFSVWCFFAALLSLFAVYLVRGAPARA
ncbi:hypothetical protein BDK63_003514 [Halomonas campaniensis]|uniref:Uncharacterized protein n=1 Tax=Halomonas campaniensis TaxID=213554 RepID=A0A7W5PD37_9GAMM|nr:DUF6629 family protein [Halomonas campaniensis]MBB3332616.1 hypothetical protein [Halomonas campaniensis]